MKYSLKKVMVLDTVPVALQYKLSYLIIFKCLIALMGCDPQGLKIIIVTTREMA